MGDEPAQFESKDTEGVTDHFNGTVGTTAVNVPASAGGIIAEVFIECMKDSAGDLLVSFDGGTTFKTITPCSVIIWTPKGNQTQLDFKGTVAGTKYETIFNRENF